MDTEDASVLLSALLMCPSLRRVELGDNVIDAGELGAMLAACAARGVAVAC